MLRAAFDYCTETARMAARSRRFVGAAMIGSLIGAIAGWHILPAPSSQGGPKTAEYSARGVLQAEQQREGSAELDSQLTNLDLTTAIRSKATKVSAARSIAGQAHTDAAGASSGQAFAANIAPGQSLSEHVYSLFEWLPPTDPRASESRCAAGEAFDCLRMAAMNASDLLPVTTAKRRHYQERAFSMLVLQCRRRVPDACAIIARMHAKECGLPRDPANESALIARARQLCLRHPGKVCAVFER
jgi:hypothetical protein